MRLAEGEVVEGQRLARLFPEDVITLSTPPGLKRLSFPGLTTRDALVLWNRSVATESVFRTRYSLPANSFAPAWLLLVPLRG